MNPRSLRLKELFNESGCKTVTAFAQECGINQPTMANYMTGIRKPGEANLQKVIARFPQFSAAWLIDGIGGKYSTYVPATGIGGDANAPVVTGNGNRVEATGFGFDVTGKLAQVYDKLIHYMERCSTLEEQLLKANELIQELKKDKEA